MTEVTNVEIFENIVQGLYTIGGRRTSQNFAAAVLDAIIKTLEKKFDFLKYVRLDADGNPENIINIASEINSVNLVKIGKAVETIIQVVYMDLREKAGLYFIKELQKNVSDNVISTLKNVGVDLALLQIQQHHIYRQHRRIKAKAATGKSEEEIKQEEKSLLAYSWDSVSSWNYDSNSNVCVIYGKDGKPLDRLNLKEIIKGYVNDLTKGGTAELPTDYERKDQQEKGLKLS